MFSRLGTVSACDKQLSHGTVNVGQLISTHMHGAKECKKLNYLREKVRNK